LVGFGFSGGWTGKPKDEQKPFLFNVIQSGRKDGTVRQTQRCHPGDRMQLYYGLRTKHCEKIGEAVCSEVYPLFVFSEENDKRVELRVPTIGGRPISLRFLEGNALERFAYHDGFDNLDLFFAYFKTGAYWMHKFKDFVAPFNYHSPCEFYHEGSCIISDALDNKDAKCLFQRPLPDSEVLLGCTAKEWQLDDEDGKER
jgi:hypothetical protein